MITRRRTLAAAGTVGALLLVTACSDHSGHQGAAAGDSSATKTAKIAVIVPVGASDPTNALGVRNAIDLAVREANASGRIPGWTLKAEVHDDKGEPEVAAAEAAKAVADPDVIAVIGSQYSSTTKAIVPITAKAGIATLSPSATNPTLTRGADFSTKPVRPYSTFFRVVASDDAQAPAIAKYLTEKKLTKVAVVDDGDTYGTGMVGAFLKNFRGTVALRTAIQPGKNAYPELVAALVKAKPQAIVYGGWDAEAGRISLGVKQAGLIVPVIGGDGLATDSYAPMAGPLSAGDMSTVPGRAADSVEKGRDFLKAYSDAEFAENPAAFGAQAYDATNALILAAKESLTSGSSIAAARADIVRNLANVKFDGASGGVAFDQYGDVTPRVVTVRALNGGQWSPVKVYEF